MADAADLKSAGPQGPCRFDPCSRHLKKATTHPTRGYLTNRLITKKKQSTTKALIVLQLETSNAPMRISQTFQNTFSDSLCAHVSILRSLLFTALSSLRSCHSLAAFSSTASSLERMSSTDSSSSSNVCALLFMSHCPPGPLSADKTLVLTSEHVRCLGRTPAECRSELHIL